MKRYFNIEEDKVTLEVGVNPVSNAYTVKEMEYALGFAGLREVDKKEFDKLTELYINE